VAVLGTVVSGTPAVGLLALLAWPFVLRAVINRGARKQRDKFRDQLPSHLQDLSGAMRSGRSVVGAIAAVAESADEPIRSELERAVADEQLGRPIEESLDAVARRMQADDMEQVSLIAALHRRSGSNVAEAFDRVAEGARSRADLRREVKALTGQAKMSSLVLTGLPPLLLIGMHFIAPAYSRPLLHSAGGIVALVIGTAMVLGGWKVMMKIIDVKV
jgi:tight adherence protein B